MARATGSCLETLERWSATMFLLAGGVLIASPTAKALTLFLDVSVPEWIVGLLVFPGLLMALHGLLGLYPAVVEGAPWLGRAGGMVAAVAAGAILLLFGWVLASNLSPSRGLLGGTGPPAAVFLLVMSLVAIGFLVFGIASRRVDSHAEPTGLSLLAFSFPWFVLLAVTPVYGAELPGWLAIAAYGVMPVALLATGTTLRGVDPRTDRDPGWGDISTG